METNETLLARCRSLIEVSLNWGDPAYWTNEDFEKLSDKIFEKTAVQLSVSTLKRIWGKVRYDSSPTTATLNALARFAGFEGWREFAAAAPAERPEPVPASEPPAPQLVATPQPTPRRFFMTALIIGTAVVVALISLFGSRFHAAQSSPPKDPADRLPFSARRISDDLPNSVVFTYDATSLSPDDVILQQSWDTTRREKIPVDGKEITSLYYYPGFFMAKLIVDGVIRSQCPVFIPTKGWKGIIRQMPAPVYLAPDEITAGPLMSVSATTLQQKTGKSLFNETWTELSDIREFPDIAADHFTFKATLRNTSTVEQCLCRRIKVTLLGTESVIIIPLSDKGSISTLGMMTGERWISGKEHDLSAFGCDFSSFQQLTCTVADHHFRVFLNDHPIFDREQKLTIGRIMGIRIEFEGSGEIKETSLQGTGAPIALYPQG